MRALALAALLAAPAAAERPLTPPAPEFPAGSAWLGSQPLPLSRLRGRKAVVVAFLDPVGLNSIRALAALKAWFDRYALSQLMVVGVVTPSLEAERDVVWLRGELKRLGVEFPVVVDSDRKLWNAYQNQGWPAMYLIDRRGLIVFDRLGEGGYQEFETEMRSALAELVGESELPARVDFAEPRSTDCGAATPNIPLGARGKPPLLAHGAARRDEIIVDSRQGEVATWGDWATESDALRLAEPNASRTAFLRVVYQASQALAVLSPPAGRRSRFFVKRDDAWLYEGVAGRDVRFDDDGRSYVDVGAARLYDLVRDDGQQAHELLLYPEQRGSRVHGLTFADACLATDQP